MLDIPFDSRAIGRAAATFATLLVLATVVFEVGADLAPDNAVLVNGTSVFSLREEENLGTFGAMLLHLGCAAAALAIAVLTADRSRRLWGVVAAGFTALAADEILVFHERFSRVSNTLLGEGAPAFGWIVPGLFVVVVLAVLLVPHLRRLPRATWRGLLLAAVVFLGGALGLEALGSALWEMEAAPDHLAGGVALVEEALEVAGTTIALWTMARHLQQHLLPARIVPPPAAGQ